MLKEQQANTMTTVIEQKRTMQALAHRDRHLQNAVRATEIMAQDGYSDLEIREIFNAALEQLAGVQQLPHARAACPNCGHTQVAWTEYQWSLIISSPCRNCGKPW